MRFITPKVLYLSAGITLFVVIFFIILISTKGNQQTPEDVTLEPTITVADPTKIIPPFIKDAPKVPPAQGGGIDENSVLIQNSISEIKKLYSFIPYSEDFVSSSGIEVSILIPRQSLQTNSWTLTAQVFGINYNTSPDQTDYEIMRVSFLEASNRVFSWVEQKNADPRKIIFVWGDRKFIHDQTENWLKSSN